MTDRNAQAGPPAKGSGVVLVAAILVGAAIIAVIGALIPGLLELTGPEASWIPFVFYAITAADLVIAYVIWSKVKKALQSSDRGGGTVRRR